MPGADEDDLGADDDDEELNSDDDDDEEESEIHTDNLVLCQYDKVTRTKNKWKAQLKFGVRQSALRALCIPCACSCVSARCAASDAL